MALETASYVSGLVSSNPTSTDQQSQGDDHLRLLKATLQATFPNASKAFRFPTDTANQTANFSISFPGDQNKVWRVNASSGNITISLPTPTGDHAPGWSCIIIRTDTSANTVTLSGGTINGLSVMRKKSAVLLIWINTSTIWYAIPLMEDFESTTAMLFAQATAPVGWTKSTSHHNKALRLVTGGTGGSAGGTTAFTTVFAARTITQANLPNITLTAAAAGAHGHDVRYNTAGDTSTSGGGARVTNLAVGGSAVAASAAMAAADHEHNVPLGGSGTAMDFAVQYVDVIIATKD